MKFVPKAPREGINVSKTHPLKEAVTLVVGISAVLAAVFALLALSVDVAVGFIPPEFEAQVFDTLKLDSAFGTVVDDERQGKVQALLDRLAARLDETPYDFRAAVVSSSDANAAALPGGYVLVTTALLDEVESENELAFVLGHELGHFHHRDHLRRLGRGVVYGLALAAVVGGSGGWLPDLATLSGELTSRGFDRRQESEADRFALELVQEEYGHVGSSWQFFERLAAKEVAAQVMVAYLATHPASAGRITELEETARSEGWPLEGPAEPF